MLKRILVAALLLASSVIALAQQTRELNLRGDRFKPLTWEQLTPEQKTMVNDVLAGTRTSLNGPFNALLRSPEMGNLAQKLGEYGRFRTSVPQRLNEMAILLTAKWWSSQYEWYAHKTAALSAGLNASVIDDIQAGRRPARMQPDETVIYDFSTELRERRRVSDATFKAAVNLLGEKGVMDLVAVMGYYDLVSMVLNVDRYPLPQGAQLPFPEPRLSDVGQGGGANDAARVLVGAIDIHVHNLPDDRPRSIDAIDVATLASSRGMRAIVLKNHYESTAGLAYLARKMAPGVEVFGGIDLNLTVGGINPAAVEHMTRVTGGWGRFVWMPTFDAENQVRYSKENRPFVSVSRDGELLPAVKQVIALVAKHGLVLATGHSAPAEALMLLREGRRQGVQHMVVTHAMNAPVLMDVPEMQEAAKLGAFIEFVGGSLAAKDADARIGRFADAIRRVGPEFCILSSDLGQQGNALPPDGFGAFLVALRARGFTETDIDRMSKQNPARLLGLP